MGELSGDIPTFDEALGGTEVFDDGRRQWYHRLRTDLLVLKGKATSVREAILLQDKELEGMRVACAEWAAKLARIWE